MSTSRHTHWRRSFLRNWKFRFLFRCCSTRRHRRRNVRGFYAYPLHIQDQPRLPHKGMISALADKVCYPLKEEDEPQQAEFRYE
nr:hypothetical protein CFP56_76055 [Quercus suber]